MTEPSLGSDDQIRHDVALLRTTHMIEDLDDRQLEAFDRLLKALPKLFDQLAAKDAEIRRWNTAYEQAEDDIADRRARARQARADLALLRELNVTVTDSAAAEGITPEGMLGYLGARGWLKVVERPRELWQPCSGWKCTLVPLDTTYADFGARVRDLAHDIAAREGRGVLGVLLDLRAQSRLADDSPTGGPAQ